MLGLVGVFCTRHRPTYSATLRVLIHGFESRPTGWEPQIRKAEPALSLGRSDDSQHSNPATSCERGQNSISSYLDWLGAMSIEPFENSVCQIQKSLPGPFPSRGTARTG